VGVVVHCGDGLWDGWAGCGWERESRGRHPRSAWIVEESGTATAAVCAYIGVSHASSAFLDRTTTRTT